MREFSNEQVGWWNRNWGSKTKPADAMRLPWKPQPIKADILVWLIILAVWMGGALCAPAQNFAIDWFTIAGGGGTSTGGVYSVSATVGQPGAGMASGGAFDVSGGFWSVSDDAPSAPRLSIRLSSTNTVIISWFAPSDFALEQSVDLSPTNWSPVGTPPETVGNENQLIVPAPAGLRFYRLLQQH